MLLAKSQQEMEMWLSALKDMSTASDEACTVGTTDCTADNIDLLQDF